MFAPNPAALARFVQRLLLRSELSVEERDAVLALPIELQQVRTNRDFVALGEELEHACLIIDGLAGRFEQTRNGKRQITAVHLPGDMADLHSVVIPKTSWALQALSSTTIGRIPHEALVTVSDRYPRLARAFWRDCSVDASVIAGWTVSLGLLSAKARLAHFLCEMRCRYDAAGLASGDGFDLPMTQAHLGDALGLTSVHVNRMAQALKHEGLASIGDRRVTIMDWARLVRVAEFDPAYLHFHDGTMGHNDPARRSAGHGSKTAADGGAAAAP